MASQPLHQRSRPWPTEASGPSSTRNNQRAGLRSARTSTERQPTSNRCRSPAARRRWTINCRRLSVAPTVHHVRAPKRPASVKTGGAIHIPTDRRARRLSQGPRAQTVVGRWYECSRAHPPLACRPVRVPRHPHPGPTGAGRGSSHRPTASRHQRHAPADEGGTQTCIDAGLGQARGDPPEQGVPKAPQEIEGLEGEGHQEDGEEQRPACGSGMNRGLIWCPLDLTSGGNELRGRWDSRHSGGVGPRLMVVGGGGGAGMH